MNGKSKCKILKDIRRQIAEENDIAYVTSECKFQGECSGTCPKCEAEVRYLEEELAKRQRAGKAVAVAGIAAALLVGTTGCDLDELFLGPQGGSPVQPSESQTQPSTDPTQNTQELMGEPVETEETTAGVPMPSEDFDVLMGDMPLEYVDDFWGIGNDG